jgi:hypothetical protein
MHGFALPQMLIASFPPLGHLASAVAYLPYLGDGRTLAVPEVILSLGLGWFIVLTLPHPHKVSARRRPWLLVMSFALTAQALLITRQAVPFLYFRF